MFPAAAPIPQIILLLFAFAVKEGQQQQVLDENAAKELKCGVALREQHPGTQPHMKWVGHGERLYLPLWSSLTATRIATDIFARDANSIHFNEIQPASCLAVHGNHVVEAWGHRTTYNTTVLGDTKLHFQAPWVRAIPATFQFHLTDRDSYALGVICWEDDEAGWAVVSTKPHLDPLEKRKILDYVKSLGFSEGKAVDENYDLCDENGNAKTNAKKQVPQLAHTYHIYNPIYPIYVPIPYRPSFPYITK